MYSTFVSKVLFPAIQLVERRHFLSILDWYSKCQYLPYKDLKVRQEEKLRQLVFHAYQNVPFYREKFDAHSLKPQDISTIEDLPKIPIITKLEIRQNFPNRLVAQNIPANRRARRNTSGSTGTPLAFFLDTASWDYARASFLLLNEWTGIKPGEKYVWVGSRHSRLSTKVRLSHLLQRYTRFSTFGITRQDMVTLLRRIARIGPAHIGGPALIIFRLAQLATEYGIEIRPKAVVSTAEVMPSREAVEKAFSCPVFDRYGSLELNGYLAQNCNT